MKSSKTSDLVKQNILLLIPFIVYALYKNGFLIYAKKLISIYEIFKPLYLCLIGVLIKIIIDLIHYKKIKLDYDLIVIILISMIVPYNVNILIYTISILLSYIFILLVEKYINFNKVCFVYLIIILILFLNNNLIFKTPLEINYTFNFSFLDLFFGRNIGGISSTSIFLSLISYIILLNNYYYKKDIPIWLNISYLIITFTYFILKNNWSFILNSEVIFASIFICSLPEFSPFKRKNQIIYAIIIGVCSALASIYFNSIISIYIITFIMSLFLNIKKNK